MGCAVATASPGKSWAHSGPASHSPFLGADTKPRRTDHAHRHCPLSSRLNLAGVADAPTRGSIGHQPSCDPFSLSTSGPLLVQGPTGKPSHRSRTYWQWQSPGTHPSSSFAAAPLPPAMQLPSCALPCPGAPASILPPCQPPTHGSATRAPGLPHC